MLPSSTGDATGATDASGDTGVVDSTSESGTTGAAAVCGNGIIEASEACDDEGESPDCNDDCTLVSCGDAVVNVAAGEECDDGGESASCDDDCTSANCGDAVVNVTAREQCDDGGESATCNDDCTPATCGDAIVNVASGEACDDGSESATCDADCTTATCGDGVLNVSAGETCDDGGESATCDADCTPAACGDSVTNLSAGEACDDGGVQTASCEANCTAATCGDAIVNALASETCDDANTDPLDGCGNTCLVGVRDIAAGDGHTCAILADHTLRCWGWGNGGRLGYANTETIGNDELPNTVGAVSLGATPASIDLGIGHGCVVDVNDGVRCWGLSQAGQLGYGNTETIGDDEIPSAAGIVSVGGPVVQVSAGLVSTCALLTDGSVLCWGGGLWGTLGYGNTASIGDDELPIAAGDVSLGATALAVTSGRFHACAVLEGGMVRCWGDNPYGQLGLGHTETIGDDEVPSSAPVVDVGGTVVEISAGNHHTCARLDDGAVRCWGASAWGLLGYGNAEFIGDDESPTDAGDVQLGGVAVQLASAQSHTCALLEDGTVRCWGQGLLGRLGYGNTANIGDDETPASAGPVPLGGTAAMLTAFGEHTCAIMTTGQVRCWGAGGSGRLGYGNTDNIGDDEPASAGGDVQVY